MLRWSCRRWRVIIIISSLFSIVILSFLFCSVAVAYGSGGAVVVAGKARQALAIVLPLRALPLAAQDVAYGANLGTFAALYAVAGGAERLVADYPSDESSAQQVAVDAWPLAADGADDARATLPDVGNKLGQHLASRLALGLLLFGRVNVHEGQPHIALGHDERELAGGLQADGREVAVQVFHGEPDVVASSAQCPAVMTARGRLQLQSSDKSPDQLWRPPSVNGEAETDAFVFFQTESGVAACLVSHVHKSFS